MAGFPCQPFSSSGHRSGFAHQSGNVFEGIVRLVSEVMPSVVFFENVQGLLSNKAGHTFARILLELTTLGYTVDWALIDLVWFGVPQTRPRLLIVGTLDGRGESVPAPNGEIPSAQSSLSPLFRSLGLTGTLGPEGSLAQVERDRRPAIGVPHPSGALPFGRGGRAVGEMFHPLQTERPSAKVSPSALHAIVAPNLADGGTIRSGRYWARGKPTSLYLRPNPVSHCVGTSLGGAPLYAIPLELVTRPSDREAFLAHANWNREENGYLVMRLAPERAVRLFGPHTRRIETSFRGAPGGMTLKYKAVGNMLPPVMAEGVARALSSTNDRVTSSR